MAQVEVFDFEVCLVVEKHTALLDGFGELRGAFTNAVPNKCDTI
jgi:hypothetical protein